MLGEIAIWESEKTGDRLYRGGEIFQSQSSATGESRLPYVKMMEGFLDDTKSVLVLGCEEEILRRCCRVPAKM
jgi:hypothetical protein